MIFQTAKDVRLNEVFQGGRNASRATILLEGTGIIKVYYRSEIDPSIKVYIDDGELAAPSQNIIDKGVGSHLFMIEVSGCSEASPLSVIARGIK